MWEIAQAFCGSQMMAKNIDQEQLRNKTQLSLLPAIKAKLQMKPFNNEPCDKKNI